MTGQLFGRYLLVEKLAEGGMAQVYRAVLRETDGFEKQVALKRVLKELSADPDFVVRFIDEARIVSTLSHSNIVQVFDFGQHEGEHFLAMELLDGPDLGTLLAACAARQQLLAPAEALYIAAEMARGLGAAHRHSDSKGTSSPIIHRDVSPQNVLLSRSGEVKVVDFGIAKAANKSLRTRTGVIMGKCRYMAPEQALGEPVDARTDVFSAGCVLFEMLAGRPLFDGQTTDEVFHQLLRGSIPTLSQVISACPPLLEQILGQCLARDKSQRYADGAVLARELELLLHRAAPDFSREDLVASIDRVLPRRSGWQQLHTIPGATLRELVGADTQPALAADEQAAAAPAADLTDLTDLATAPRDVRPAAEAAVLVSPEPTPAPSPAAVEPPPESGTGLDDPAPARGRLQRRLGLALLGAILVGGLIGLAAARLSPRAPPRQAAPLGRSIQHGGWQLQLEQVSARRSAAGPRLLLQLRVKAPAGAALPPERYLLLESGRQTLRPCFWLAPPRAPDTRQIVFAADPAQAASLLFVPPGAPPLRLSLPARPSS